MATFGKLTNAIVSATSENTLALANLNFDFSIVKFNAPQEFHAFGASLSRQRRTEAEDGSIHKTARRLGALFEDLVPITPGLIKAYGARTSDIAISPDVNPKGSSKHGFFEAYVGADGTSIWAAATSADNGDKAHAPLAMHLLACVLARTFRSEEAISIWVELVRSRRHEIEHKLDREPQPISACLAARQDITRDHLALWDTSARSWLRGADEAKKVQRIQLQLLVDKLHLQFTSRNSTYEAVMNVWRNAMDCMEKCVMGVPQQISDGSILLALSSWHLYPDLIVAHETTKKVAFNDDLLKSCGALTIGLEFAPGSRPAGVHWSLTLSHLKYYGNPIEVESSNEIQRFTMDQLLVILFGDLMSSWSIPKEVEQQITCAKWLIEFADALAHGASVERSDVVFNGTFSGPPPNDRTIWIRLLALSGLRYLELHHNDPQICSMLAGWGRRRARKFLGSIPNSPFFGLNSPLLMRALRKSDPLEAGIEYLRNLAEKMNLQPGEGVIRHVAKLQRNSRIELLTAVPHTRSHSKRAFDGTCVPQQVHCRWVGLVVDRTQDIVPSSCSCIACNAWCPCANNRGRCNTYCHASNPQSGCIVAGGWVHTRDQTITSTLGEECWPLHIQSIRDVGPLVTPQSDSTMFRMVSCDLQSESFVWENPPGLFHNHNAPTSPLESCPSLSNGAMKCSCFSPCEKPSTYYHDACFKVVHGSAEGLALFVRTQPWVHDGISIYQTHYARAAAELAQTLKPADATIVISQFKDRPSSILAELMNYQAQTDAVDSSDSGPGTYNIESLAKLLAIARLPVSYTKSLALLYIAHEVYEDLVGATIPTEILKTALHHCRWLAHDWGRASTRRGTGAFDAIFEGDALPISRLLFPNRQLRRAERFACIAWFESGCYNVSSSNCEPVIALASANSIFVAEELLRDPAAPKTGRVMRVVGNFGRPGISMLVLPQDPPIIRPLGNNWRAVPHQPYNNVREDNLGGTTMVLSFTDWKRALPVSERGSIDEEVSFIEGVVSVHDRGTWVADIDLTDLNPCGLLLDCACDDGESSGNVEITSIDSWEELLDAPDNISVFRAHGNWAARLAAAAIRQQQGHGAITWIVPPGVNPCSKCLTKAVDSSQQQRLRKQEVKFDTKTLGPSVEVYAGQIGVFID